MQKVFFTFQKKGDLLSLKVERHKKNIDDFLSQELHSNNDVRKCLFLSSVFLELKKEKKQLFVLSSIKSEIKTD